jgi:hypothetical protein
MKKQLIEILKQALQEQPKQDCGCGCGNCGKAVRLNESKQYDAPISEGLRYHINNKLTLQDTIYRPGSKAHIELVHEARLLWKQGVIATQECACCGEDVKKEINVKSDEQLRQELKFSNVRYGAFQRPLDFYVDGAK